MRSDDGIRRKAHEDPGIKGTAAGKHPELPNRAKKEAALGNKEMLPARLSRLCQSTCTYHNTRTCTMSC